MSMFVASILAVGVCPPGDVAIYPTPNDVRLMIAQEDFFIDAAPPGLRNLEDRFPDTTFPSW